MTREQLMKLKAKAKNRLQTNKWFRRVFNHFTDPAVKIYGSLQTLTRNPRHFAKLPDPFELVYVNPNDVQKYGEVKWRNKYRFSTGVEPGTWDEDLESFHNHPLYEAMRQRFIQGVEWKETEFVRNKYNLVTDKKTVWNGCKSPKDIKNRCQSIDQLFHAIKDNGYKTQRELYYANNDPMPKSGYLGPPEVHEVEIDVARDGELIYENGRHRLIIAQLLDIDRIPVRIVVRHAKFAEENISDNIGNEFDNI